MTTRYTNAEWAAIIEQTERELVVSETKAYLAPDVGSPAFMKTIDHTLLKLDAKAVQIDALCSEARVDGFAVRSQFFSFSKPLHSFCLNLSFIIVPHFCSKWTL